MSLKMSADWNVPLATLSGVAPLTVPNFARQSGTATVWRGDAAGLFAVEGHRQRRAAFWAKTSPGPMPPVINRGSIQLVTRPSRGQLLIDGTTTSAPSIAVERAVRWSATEPVAGR